MITMLSIESIDYITQNESVTLKVNKTEYSQLSWIHGSNFNRIYYPIFDQKIGIKFNLRSDQWEKLFHVVMNETVNGEIVRGKAKDLVIEDGNWLFTVKTFFIENKNVFITREEYKWIKLTSDKVIEIPIGVLSINIAPTDTVVMYNDSFQMEYKQNDIIEIMELLGSSEPWATVGVPSGKCYITVMNNPVYILFSNRECPIVRRANKFKCLIPKTSYTMLSGTGINIDVGGVKQIILPDGNYRYEYVAGENGYNPFTEGWFLIG